MWHVKGDRRDAYRVLAAKPERRLLGRHGRRWKDNIKMDLRDVAWGAWTGLLWFRTGTGGRVL
jgi:hypothetical protein